MRLLVVMFFLGAALVVAPAAQAANQPLPYSALNPADGYSQPASSWPSAADAEMFDFFIDTSFVSGTSRYLVLEVSTSNLRGQDGTLADDYQVGY
jgi:hypothetical protein